jgi:hypothetical protein
VRGKIGTWYGKSSDGNYYQYFSDHNIETVHFAGTIPKSKVPNDSLKQIEAKK